MQILGPNLRTMLGDRRLVAVNVPYRSVFLKLERISILLNDRVSQHKIGFRIFDNCEYF